MGGFVGLQYQSPMMSGTGIQRVEELFFARPEDALKKGVTVAAGTPIVKEGDVMGRITASGKFRRYTRAYVKANVAAGEAKFILADESANVIVPPFKVGEAIDIDGATANNKTITAIDYETGEVTLSAVLGVGEDLTAGDEVLLHTADGSQVPFGVASRPLFNANQNYDDPNSQPLLAVDMQFDLILSAWLKKSVLHGLDTDAVTALVTSDLSPAFDAVKIR